MEGPDASFRASVPWLGGEEKIDDLAIASPRRTWSLEAKWKKSGRTVSPGRYRRVAVQSEPLPRRRPVPH